MAERDRMIPGEKPLQFRKTSSMFKTASGFDRKQVSDFLQRARTVGQGEKREDTSVNIKKRNFKVTKLTGEAMARGRDQVVNMDRTQLEAISSAFRARQNEVFGRRARPGISQTRLT